MAGDDRAARADADRAYVNADVIPGGAGYPARWAAAAAAFRDAHPPEVIAHGPAEADALDLFRPPGAARGLFVFVHGGYWLRFGRRDWSHLAAGALARGWAVALPSYTLAPAARIGAMAAQVAAAIRTAAEAVPGPLVVAGHSAGGQLAARLACADQTLAPRRTVPISPLADLAPLMATTMNATLRIDAAEAAAESPARRALAAGVQAHVWVGGQERPAFLWHARTLAEAWDCPWTVDPGRHHFDVVDGLTDPASPLMRTCLDGL